MGGNVLLSFCAPVVRLTAVPDFNSEIGAARLKKDVDCPAQEPCVPLTLSSDLQGFIEAPQFVLRCLKQHTLKRIKDSRSRQFAP